MLPVPGQVGRPADRRAKGRDQSWPAAVHYSLPSLLEQRQDSTTYP